MAEYTAGWSLLDMLGATRSDAFSRSEFWRPLVLVTAVAAVFGVMLALGGRRLAKLRREQAALESELEGVRQENAVLRAERDALLSSPEAIEGAAREDYGYAAPGERAERVELPPRTRPRPARHVAMTLWEWLMGTPLGFVVVPSITFVVAAAVLALWNSLAARPGRQA